MQNTNVLAATGMPSRRTAIASLAGFGAAMSLPKAARAAAAAPSPDAALIALAAKVMAMARRLSDLWCTRSELEDKASALKPDAPTQQAREKIDVQVTRGDDGSVSVFAPHWSLSPDEITEDRRHEAAVKAWGAECAKIERRIGLRAAERLCNRIDGRMQDAALALADMKPATLAGLAAKARAAEAVNPSNAFSDRWIDRLSASVIRDVVAIGGEA